MKWVLLVFVAAPAFGLEVEKIEFSTEALCGLAAQKISQDLSQTRVLLSVSCVKVSE